MVATEPIEVEGLDWLPLFKRVTYRSVAAVGTDVTRGGETDECFSKLTADSPVEFHFELEGQRTAIGFQSRRSLHDGLRDELEEWIRWSVIEHLLAVDAQAQAARAAAVEGSREA